MTISTPSSAHGSCAGSRSAKTRTDRPLTDMLSSSEVISASKMPCELSYLSKCAFVATGPRSLIATTSTSVRPCSIIERNTKRPIRPKPLIAIRIAINLPLNDQQNRKFAESIDNILKTLNRAVFLVYYIFVTHQLNQKPVPTFWVDGVYNTFLRRGHTGTIVSGQV